jgi:hypothetical protein
MAQHPAASRGLPQCRAMPRDFPQRRAKCRAALETVYPAKAAASTGIVRESFRMLRIG